MKKVLLFCCLVSLTCYAANTKLFSLPSARHQFVVGKALDFDQQTSQVTSGQTTQLKQHSLPATTTITHFALDEPQQNALNLSEAAVFFQQALFLTYTLVPEGLAGHQLLVSQCFTGTAWRQLNQAGYVLLLQQVHAEHAKVSMVPLMPPRFSVQAVAKPATKMGFNVVMPILLAIQIANQAIHTEQLNVEAHVAWVGHNKGLRGWQIQAIKFHHQPLRKDTFASS